MGPAIFQVSTQRFIDSCSSTIELSLGSAEGKQVAGYVQKRVQLRRLKNLNISDFREQCLHLLDELPAEKVIVTERGKPIAKVVSVIHSTVNLFGLIPNFRTNPDDDLFSTGIEATADEENVKPRYSRSR